MLRNVLVHLFLAIAVAGIAAAEAAAGSSPEVEMLHVELKNVNSREAVTVIRAIVGIETIETVDERNIKVTDSSEHLATVKAVVELVDVKPGQEPAVETIRVESDQTEIARSMLQSPIYREVMTALREQIQAKHIAVVQDPPLVILRDSPEKVQAAKRLIKSMQETVVKTE